MRRINVGLFALLVSLASSAHAQEERNLDIERFRPTPDRDGFLGMPGTRTPGEWQWNVGLWLGYEFEPLTLRRLSDGSRLPVVAHRVGADFVAQLGIFDRAAVVLDVPMVVWQDTDHQPLDMGPAISAVALRDPFLGVRVRVFGDGSNGENTDQEGPGIALQGAVTIPVGLEESFAGEGSPQLDFAVLADFHFLHFGLGAIVGYRHRFAEPRLLGTQFANELYFGAAVQSPVFFVENVSAIFEVRTDTSFEVSATDEISVFNGPSTAVEGDLGVRWAEGDFMMTWLVGTAFSAGVGAPAFRATYGLVWAPRVHDVDGDGFSDGDERPDCVRLPEDRDGFQDEDGCPDPDDDGDGAADANDRCPRVAEDRDGQGDDDGCPDPDDDRDGVIDGEDRCADRDETINGIEDGDGCPDTGGSARWRPSGEGEQPGLRGTIRFDAEGAIASVSSASVDQLARHLIARWGSRWSILIPAGGSEARGAALREALVGRGVSADSIEIGASESIRGMNVEVSALAP